MSASAEPIRVRISCVSAALFQVILSGPGGWTATFTGDRVATETAARGLAQVLGVPVEEFQ